MKRREGLLENRSGVVAAEHEEENVTALQNDRVSLESVPRTFELAATQLEASMVTLEADGDLVDRKFTSGRYIFNTGIKVCIQHRAHLV